MSKRLLHVFPDHCVHTRNAGPLKPTCALGVDVRKHVGGSDYGWRARMPCRGRSFAKPDCQTVECDRHELPTAETVARDQAEQEADIAKLLGGTCPNCDSAMTRMALGSFCPKCPDVYTHECRAEDVGP